MLIFPFPSSLEFLCFFCKSVQQCGLYSEFFKASFCPASLVVGNKNYSELIGEKKHCCRLTNVYDRSPDPRVKATDLETLRVEKDAETLALEQELEHLARQILEV